MLEIKNVTRIYRPKKGAPVRALDGISLRFPDTGMIFILGKSGSGKSTLLNVMGGLDKYDSGEIIIKDKSSKDFKQDDFDSYRNTYLGFIFQEYNILNEFSVGANIALALQLQGKKATDEEVNAILEEVDLAGYGNRRPDELSGGQKQRVAIARALVKNPQIILADEPTGALDSATGLQIFDTLKKLSKNKLVITVTHDREFAEQYGDRVIELKDGKVVSDITKYKESAAGSNFVVSDKIIQVKKGYRLTPEDFERINSILREEDAMISFDKKLNDNLRAAARLDEDGNRESFRETDNAEIVSGDTSSFKLIKSRLPVRHMFRMGGSSLRNKPFRLVVTILLSMIAFGLFGLSDTISAYDRPGTLAKSLQDSNIQYLSFTRAYRQEYDGGAYYTETKMTLEDTERLESETGIDFYPVFSKADFSIKNLNNAMYLPYYSQSFSGFYEGNAEQLRDIGFELKGKYPENFGEIAISEYIFTHFQDAGYKKDAVIYSADSEELRTAEAFLAEKPYIDIGNETYLITGIIDTGFEADRYKSLKEEQYNYNVEYFLLSSQLRSAVNYGYHALVYVPQGFVDNYLASSYDAKEAGLQIQEFGNMSIRNMDTNDFEYSGHETGEEMFYGCNATALFRFSQLSEAEIPYICTGEAQTLSDNEIMLDFTLLYDYLYAYMGNLDIGQAWQEFLQNPAVADEYLDNLVMDYSIYPANLYENQKKVDVKGFFYTGYSSGQGYQIAVSDGIYQLFDEYKTGDYSFAIAPMPEKASDILRLAEYNYNQTGAVGFRMQSEVNYFLDQIDFLLSPLARVFLYIGLGFAVFAGLMLMNYISTSIAYKKREIGILRAVGARSNDVFGIFFSESLIIALINYVLSMIAVIIAVVSINAFLRNQYGFLLTILQFGIRQAALMLGISLLVAFAGSFLPVVRIAKKRPIDAINNR
jgi:ABC-type lipoprotein export system ATPase subunit